MRLHSVLVNCVVVLCAGGRPGIFVKAIIAGSVAAADGRIHVNDQIVGVHNITRDFCYAVTRFVTTLTYKVKSSRLLHVV
jgi:C-terminal processing protease CtpA/Prc